jgi:hypothetical protein
LASTDVLVKKQLADLSFPISTPLDTILPEKKKQQGNKKIPPYLSASLLHDCGKGIPGDTVQLPTNDKPVRPLIRRPRPSDLRHDILVKKSSILRQRTCDTTEQAPTSTVFSNSVPLATQKGTVSSADARGRVRRVLSQHVERNQRHQRQPKRHSCSGFQVYDSIYHMDRSYVAQKMCHLKNL